MSELKKSLVHTQSQRRSFRDYGLFLLEKSKIIPGRENKPGPSLSGRLWPSGRFSIGSVPFGGKEPVRLGVMGGPEDVGTIGLSLPSNCHRNIEDVPSVSFQGRGANGITAHGRNVVESAVCLMERIYGRRKLGFATLTLPSVTVDESWVVSARWRDIQRTFFQRLKREYARRGVDFCYVAVTEIQGKRFEKTGVLGLHLHFCYPAMCGRGFVLGPSEFRKVWLDCIRGIIGDIRGGASVENIQRVKKSASAYMAKYLSKGVGILRKVRDSRPLGILPHSWYGLSISLRRMVKGCTITSPSLVSFIYEIAQVEEFQDAFVYVRDFIKAVGGRERLLGIYGKLDDQIRKEAQRWWGLEAIYV